MSSNKRKVKKSKESMEIVNMFRLEKYYSDKIMILKKFLFYEKAKHLGYQKELLHQLVEVANKNIDELNKKTGRRYEKHNI